MKAMTEPRPELDRPLRLLQLGARARRAAEQCSVHTVRDFLLLERECFLATPGCTERSWREIESRVLSYLAMRSGDDDPLADDARPIAPLLADAEHARQLADNGIRTVADFLARDKKDAQRIPCLRKSGWLDLMEAIVRTQRQPPAAQPLLPTSLRAMPLRSLGLAQPWTQRLADLGCSTIGHALSLPATVFETGGSAGTEAAEAIRAALEALLAPAIAPAQPDAREADSDWPSLRARLLAALDEENREWFCARVGIADSTGRIRSVSTDGPNQLVAEKRDLAARNRLTLRAPSLLQRLREEYLRELEAFEGAVPADRIATGTWLHTIKKGSGDTMLPLRLLAFCFPEEACVDGSFVSAVEPRVWQKLRQRMRVLTARRRLPISLQELTDELSSTLPEAPRGVVTRLVAELPRLCIRIDERQGEIVKQAEPEVARRLEQLLVERGQPTRFLDLVFDYRERFQSASEQALRSRMSRSQAFVQIAEGTWSLARWHQDEIEQLAPVVDKVCAAVCASNEKLRIASLHEGDDRERWLLTGLVRRDPRVRWLGRGEACAATLGRSRVLDQLLRDFRRAAGEVPMSRFLENQPQDRRRLVERLLRHNRLFVFPAPDRIDLLTNYPFNAERLARLTRLVDEFLAARNGYAPLQLTLDEVNRCDLGGSWLHTTLLGELLRRHGPFEILPGGYVARRSLGLVGWLMRRARAALRDAALPITVEEMLAQRPELAEFAPCLHELLAHDPLVQTPDGERYQIA